MLSKMGGGRVVSNARSRAANGLLTSPRGDTGDLSSLESGSRTSNALAKEQEKTAKP